MRKPYSTPTGKMLDPGGSGSVDGTRYAVTAWDVRSPRSSPPPGLYPARAQPSAVASMTGKGLPHKGTEVEISFEKLTSPARLSEVRIVVHTPSELTPEHTAGVNGSVHRCILHNTLAHYQK
ncbi:hypothetical protein [Terriglobus albidus]|uniref:hypothetical protein n=1 Tax=Terriglobus albidus TaxID=1592106 RepID=UPI0021E08E00|nr:hypothetical protein [Terriglobus albidus]